MEVHRRDAAYLAPIPTLRRRGLKVIRLGSWLLILGSIGPL